MRTLLLLARYGQQDKPQRVLPTVSQETLAEMVGSTRSGVNFFMNKFRKLGFIKYSGGCQVDGSLPSVVPHDSTPTFRATADEFRPLQRDSRNAVSQPNGVGESGRSTHDERIRSRSACIEPDALGLKVLTNRIDAILAPQTRIFVPSKR